MTKEYKKLSIKEKIFRVIFFTLFVLIVGVFGWFIIGNIVQKSDEVIYQTEDSLYVKQYSIYNTDTIVCGFKQPQRYNGIITSKHKHARYIGIANTGGHSISYHTTITCNGKIYETNNGFIYDTYKEGDEVIIEEIWYPRHTIKVLCVK